MMANITASHTTIIIMLPLPLALVVAKIIIFPPVFTAMYTLPENTFIYNSGLVR